MDSMMMVALILADRTSTQEALSALPDAPTVAYVAKVSMLGRVRDGLADALHRLADLVSPPVYAVRVLDGQPLHGGAH